MNSTAGLLASDQKNEQSTMPQTAAQGFLNSSKSEQKLFRRTLNLASSGPMRASKAL